MPRVDKVGESWGIVMKGVEKQKIWAKLGKVIQGEGGGYAQVIHRGVNKF